MSPRPDVSEERTNQILNAASDVFSRLGFHKARVNDIAEEAGLSKGTLYWYFKSKDDIINALLDRLFEHGISGLRELQAADESATEKLLQFTERTIDEIDQLLNMLPLTYEFLGLIFRRKNVKIAFKRYFHSYMDLLTPIIQQGINAGEFRDVDAHDVAVAVSAVFEGTILLWVYDSDAVDLKKHIQKGIQLLIDGIKA
ncbi:MAG: TetR/AcrR family transcriptional regulator [Chloroflexota bacterium]|nr:TetR/AcrR family transcriptional regulator [Chloroflexota bacterium]